jgi:hypothetical protein
MVESRGFLRDPQGLKNVERRKRYADQRLCRLAERQADRARPGQIVDLMRIRFGNNVDDAAEVRRRQSRAYRQSRKSRGP